MADPRVIQMIVAAAKKYHADPVAMLATSLVENGARGGLTPGDQGTSFGYFQMHRGGALGNNTPQWATGPGPAESRAQEFARLGVHGGKGAAAVQRPADQAGYAQKVDAMRGTAQKLLKSNGNLVLPDGTRSKGPQIPGNAPQTAPQTLSAQIGGMTPTTPAISAGGFAQQAREQLGLKGTDPLAKLQEMIQQAQPAQAVGGAPLPDGSTSQTLVPGKTPGKTATSTGMVKAPGSGKIMPGQSPVIGEKNGKLIGLPYQGTHKLYNNWESDNAIDIAAPAHTPVYATEDGTIGSQIGPIGGKDPHMAGQRVHLDNGDQSFYYQHLASLTVSAGEKVKKGQIIGYTGAMNHLHFGVKTGDPRNYYK